MKALGAILLGFCACFSASCSTSNSWTSAARGDEVPDDLQQRQISAFEKALGASDTLGALREVPVDGWVLRNPRYLSALRHCTPSFELQASQEKGRFYRQWKCDKNNEAIKRDFEVATVGTTYIFKEQWLIEISIDLSYPILIGGQNG